MTPPPLPLKKRIPQFRDYENTLLTLLSMAGHMSRGPKLRLHKKNWCVPKARGLFSNHLRITQPIEWIPEIIYDFIYRILCLFIIFLYNHRGPIFLYSFQIKQTRCFLVLTIIFR